jgi:hypothetical protein
MVSADGTGIISQAGGLLLTRTLRVTGLDRGLDAALERWRPARAAHSPGKIVTDLAVALALGGDCLADVAMLRSQPELSGPVAPDPVVSRLVARLAGDALTAIRAARAAARARAWELAGGAAPGAETPPARRDSRAARHAQDAEKGGQPQPQVTKPRSRKMQASVAGVPADSAIGPNLRRR